MKKLLIFSSLIILGLIAFKGIGKKDVNKEAISNLKVFSASDDDRGGSRLPYVEAPSESVAREAGGIGAVCGNLWDLACHDQTNQ